jgi:hypothetical protein
MLAIFTTCRCAKGAENRAFPALWRIGTLFAPWLASIGPGGYPAMYDREFFTSKLGVAALVSIAAMVTFNVFALTHQLNTVSDTVVVAAPVVELA